MLPGLAVLAGFILVLLGGVLVIVVRVVDGKKAVEDWPGWVCWGGHIILSLSAASLAAWFLPRFIASTWPPTKPELALIMLLDLAALVGGYFFGVWFIGEGKDRRH